MWNKLRPNAVLLCGMATGISVYLLWQSIALAKGLVFSKPAADAIQAGDVALVVGIATLAVTVTAGTVSGIIALAAQMATDAPPPQPPQYPAREMNDILKHWVDTTIGPDKG